MKPVAQDLESLISCLGGRGRFQIIIQILAAYTYVILVFNHVIMAFHGAPIPHICKAGRDIDNVNISLTSHLTEQKQFANISYSMCLSTLYYLDGQNETIKCSDGQWDYNPSYQERNIVSQFNLVCNREHLVSLATTLYFVGVMVGGLIFGYLADRFGRLPILFFTLYTSAILGVVTAFSVNYIMFVILRFFTGILMQGMQTSAYTLILELFTPKYRPFAGAVTECFFGSAIMLLACIAYAIQDWQYLQIAVSMPTLLTIFYPWVVPESLRWLIIKGKLEKAEVLINKICRINKISFPADVWEKLKKNSHMNTSDDKPQKQYNLTDLFRTSHVRTRSLILFYLWFVISASYYGLTFKMTSFKASRYLIFFIGGLVETAAYALTMPVMNSFGRKKPLLACFIVAAVMCVAAGVINDYTKDLVNLTIGFALAGRCAVAGLFGIIFVYTSEIYPTVMRNIGMGACCVWARAGGVVAPQINEWAKVLWGIDAITIFGVMCLIAGIFLFPLVETHNQKLPDSLNEVEENSRDEEVKDCNGATPGVKRAGLLMQNESNGKSMSNKDEHAV